jgi:quinol monooxygenase YgiN
MYARYTEFEFDPSDRESVLEFWESTAVPSASRQPGWRGAYVLESDEREGALRTFTLWESAADFERYQASEEHGTLGAGIRGSGLRTVAREGLSARFMAAASGALVRVTRATAPLEQVGAVTSWWREEGGPITRRAPGCTRAEAYWSAPGRFELVVAWTDRGAAQAFLEGPDHARFKEAMDGMGCTVVERIAGDRVA